MMKNESFSLSSKQQLLALLFTVLTASLCVAKVEKRGGPAVQELTSHWLKVKVAQVEVVEGQVSAQAEVLKIFKGEDALKVGDTISIQYKGGGKVTMGPDGKPTRPKGPQALKEGQHTFAFLNQLEDDTYTPGADVWSFAPPFGISAEKQKEYGIELPRPPSFAPPTMKNGPPVFPKGPGKANIQKAPKAPATEEHKATE